MQEIKSNKGITLIALVVTIIILLILAGVSITTLSGDGLFRRAESGAAKYDEASRQEESTISSYIDKYDSYDNGEAGGVTLIWSEPLATRGSFINSLTPAETVNSNFFDKQIVVIKPNGTKQLINPYQAGSITVPQGTKLRFCYYNSKNHDYTGFYIADNLDFSDYKEDNDADGSLNYYEWTAFKSAQLWNDWDDEWENDADDTDIPEQYRGTKSTSWEIYVEYENGNNPLVPPPGPEEPTLPPVDYGGEGSWTLSWTYPLATRGSFINSLTPAESVNSNYYNKQIVIIKPDNSKVLIDPYKPGTIKIKSGTKVRFYCYNSPEYYGTVMYVPSDSYSINSSSYYIQSYKSSDADGALATIEWTPKGSYNLSKNLDGIMYPGDGWDAGWKGQACTAWEIKAEAVHPDTITIKWAEAIARRGSFINSLTPDEYRNSNYYDKQVVVNKPDGTKQILNPYQATEVIVPYNSTLSFYYYRSKDDEGTFYRGPGAYYKILDDSTYDTIIDGAKDGKLMIATTFKLTDDTQLYFVYDNIFTWSREGAWKDKEISFWDIRDHELAAVK